jgi:restriction system protein
MFRRGWNARSGRGPGAESQKVLTSVRELSWEGYLTLVADIFKRHGHDVFDSEGPDRDVIDMEVSRDGRSRHIVNCQLRGMSQIPSEPLREMAIVGLRNGADGVLVITDGDFSPEARKFARSHSLVLVDGDALFELVRELALGDERDRRISARLTRMLGTTAKN